MIGGILVMGAVGVVVGVGLALASKIFYVYVDPKVEAVDEALDRDEVCLGQPEPVVRSKLDLGGDECAVGSEAQSLHEH